MSPKTSASNRLTSVTEQQAPAHQTDVADVVPDAGTKAHELIGGRLREARLRIGLGVRELSRQLEISASSISQIELGRVVPSVSTLYALTNALDISMDSLFGSDGDDIGEPQAADEGPSSGPGPVVAVQPASAGPLSTAHERSVVLRRDNRRAIDLERGVRWELLTPVPEPGAEFLEVHYPVGGGSGATGEAIRHNGRDYCLILEGSLSVQIGFEQYVLSSGDSLAFDGTVPHRLWNEGRVAVRAVWFVLDRWLPHGAAETDWKRKSSHELITDQ
jgi:transcriptional regulator with XRE-family HTH domain/quercetin dioxygenase-like cupin family protein